MTTHICLPGPSFEWPKVAPADLVIGVNLAAAKMKRCDVFATLAEPGDRVVRSVVHRVRLMDAAIVTMGGAVTRWRGCGFSVTDWPHARPEWFWRAYSGSHFSMFTALSYAMATVQGTIHVWGCDLEGRAYCTGQKPHSARWMEQRRWPAEFANLRRIHAAALEHEVDLRVHGRVARRLPGAEPEVRPGP